MKLVVLGPPGAGKSTQSRRLSKELSYFHVSTGNIVRAHIQAGTDFGRAVEGYNRRGELVPDELVMEMLHPNLEPAGRWLLDGFPRTAHQARMLDDLMSDMNLKMTRAILLEVPDDVLKERVKHRRYSEATGWTYNLEYDPPPQAEQHLDPGPFVRREDDDPDVFRRQVSEYHEEIKPLTDHYEQRGILTRIDGHRHTDEVTADILTALGFDDREVTENVVRVRG